MYFLSWWMDICVVRTNPWRQCPKLIAPAALTTAETSMLFCMVSIDQVDMLSVTSEDMAYLIRWWHRDSGQWVLTIIACIFLEQFFFSKMLLFKRHWLDWGSGIGRHAIIWSNDDQNLWNHMAPTDRNEAKCSLHVQVHGSNNFGNGIQHWCSPL